MSDFILLPGEFRILERLRLNLSRSFSGRVRGERLTAKRGLSIEFSDYREYAEGDDLRHLDWNVLARLDTPIMKTYRDEEDLAVHLLIDASSSMSFGEPSKFEQAKRLAAAIAYVALCGGDALYPATLGLRTPPIQGLRNRTSFQRFAAWCSSHQPEGNAGLAASAKAFASSSARAGLCILLTDGFDPEIAQGIRILTGRGHEVNLLQVLSDIELDPDIEGDLRLIDAESGEAVEITANAPTLREYRKRLEVHNKELEAEVLRSGGKYAQVNAKTPLDIAVRDILIKKGWVKS